MHEPEKGLTFCRVTVLSRHSVLAEAPIHSPSGVLPCKSSKASPTASSSAASIHTRISMSPPSSTNITGFSQPMLPNDPARLQADARLDALFRPASAGRRRGNRHLRRGTSSLPAERRRRGPGGYDTRQRGSRKRGKNDD